VGAMLRPQHAQHPELEIVGLTAQPLDDHVVLGAGQSHLPQLTVADHRPHEATRPRLAAITDWNRRRPSSPPSSGSAHRSGCGIIPRTLPCLFVTPATLCCEPFGLAAGSTW